MVVITYSCHNRAQGMSIEEGSVGKQDIQTHSFAVIKRNATHSGCVHEETYLHTWYVNKHAPSAYLHRYVNTNVNHIIKGHACELNILVYHPSELNNAWNRGIPYQYHIHRIMHAMCMYRDITRHFKYWFTKNTNTVRIPGWKNYYENDISFMYIY